MRRNDIIKIAPRGITYLSDKIPGTEEQWMTEIPVNCVFNKGVTGCGATTLAIKQPGHTILAMPTQGLVDNKKASNPEILGIHKDIGIDRKVAVFKYLENQETYKIATTYDSLPLVCDVLIAQGLDPYKDFFLFVDEWHILFDSYKFRNRAARKLLDRAKYFDRKTYVSATPVPREYWLRELTELPEYKLVWPDSEMPQMISCHVPDPVVYMARLCKSRAVKGGTENYHIFLNSVEGIAKMIRLAGLKPEECRIVCSQNKESLERNQRILGEFTIQTNNDPVRLFNYYTSTSFQGQDILDEDGRTFIVSEPYKDHTKMDVLTTIPQICGRIRNSKYKNEITQIWAHSEYKDVSLEEFKATIQKRIKDAEHDADCLNNMTDGGKAFLKDYICKVPYIDIDKDENKIVVDYDMANYEIVNYGIVNGQFASRCNMNSALTEAGFKVVKQELPVNQEVQLEKMITIERTPFKKIFEEYVTLRNGSMFNLGCFRMSRIEVEKPLVKEAYEKLGADKVREMKYHQGNIKRELIKRMDDTKYIKAFLLLETRLPKQVEIPKSKIKSILQEVFKELGIKRVAKAKSLKDWYEIKETYKRFDGGIVQGCFSIICPKLKVAK